MNKVSPDPDVEVHDLNKSHSKFIILASDGVTNMIKPEVAVRMVADFEGRKRRGVSNAVLELLSWHIVLWMSESPYVYIIIVDA